MSFSVVIPTRGDVDLSPILASYKGIADEVLVWDNSKRQNLSVYARYAMIEEARNDLILTQDDDCVVSAPLDLESEWLEHAALRQTLGEENWHDHVVCNMPQEFRHEFYEDHALVGFGACFHRDAPARAFARWDNSGAAPMVEGLATEMEWFYRTCDIVFTGLTPYVLVDVPYENLPWATAPGRIYRQPESFGERKKMLELVRKIRG